MIASTLYPDIEWHFFHYKELKATSPTLLVAEIDGREVVCPAAWVIVIDKTYKMHENLISKAMIMRYQEGKQTEVIIGLMGIGRRLFYLWREEFLTDALFLAIQNHLISTESDAHTE